MAELKLGLLKYASSLYSRQPTLRHILEKNIEDDGLSEA
jgi:hypothetical protein